MDNNKQHLIQAATPLAIAVISVLGAVIVCLVPGVDGKKEIATLLAGTGLAGACGLAQQVRD